MMVMRGNDNGSRCGDKCWLVIIVVSEKHYDSDHSVDSISWSVHHDSNKNGRINAHGDCCTWGQCILQHLVTSYFLLQYIILISLLIYAYYNLFECDVV